jgi:flagellar protein FlaI
MKCKFSIKKAKHKRLIVDCAECDKKGTLDDPNCRSHILNWLKRNRVDEVQFVKKDYSELYTKDHIDMFIEVIEMVRWLEENKVWESIKCELKEDEERFKGFVRDHLIPEFYSNPFKAYDILDAMIMQYKMQLEEIEKNPKRFKVRGRKDKMHETALVSYLKCLELIKSDVMKSRLMKYNVEGTIKEYIKPIIQPTFIKSYVDSALPKDSEIINMYNVAGADVRIYQHGGDKIYFVNPPELWMYPDQVSLLTKLNDNLSKQHSLEVIDPNDAREYFKRIGNENLPKIAIGASKEEIDKLSEVFTRYSAGYGLLEIFFRDKYILDIYIDSPPGSTPVYVNHEKYGNCITNIYLMPDDLDRLSSKFRAISKRPFDEANPILDMDLKDVGIRVAGLREPSTFDGQAYAFRKHREMPWTLPKMVQKGMLSAKAAALMSFLVQGQCAMLLTGARGSGKTSLLSATLAEIDQGDRIILMEDTAEIPAKSLKENGWKIEHLKNQSVISHKRGYEIAPEENLRTALRLGESVLVLGEVRGPEARVLFEAMRVGAAGNAVLGTIHGSSPYDTWDRVTNDLGVPPTSFKAIDVIVSLRYREGDSDKHKVRRVMEITEVRKKWVSNPDTEGAFFDLMKFNEYSGKEEFKISDSEVVSSICRRKGITVEQFEQLLSVKEKIILDLLRHSDDFEDLLELNHIKHANKEYRDIYSKKDIIEMYPKFHKWLTAYVKKLVEKDDEEKTKDLSRQSPESPGA